MAAVDLGGFDLIDVEEDLGIMDIEDGHVFFHLHYVCLTNKLSKHQGG